MKLTVAPAKMLLLLLLLMTEFVMAADPLDVELEDCKGKVGWHFCTPELELN